MKKHISFPSIDQFRSVVHNINQRVGYVGKDEEGNAIYDNTRPKPILNFEGTVKLHGTNASVAYNLVDGMWFQSRERIITPTDDNAGFAFFAESKTDVFLKLFTQLDHNALLATGHTLTIFGEWCGASIQKGVAITNLPKSFFIFAAKVSRPDDEEFVAYWINSSSLVSEEDHIYNVENYAKFTIDIDFNSPQMVQNVLARITEDVEAECPIGKAFGYSGVGEGVVWKAEFNGDVYRFKVKGEKHSVSKVKVLAPVNTERLESVQKFVDYAVTPNRFDQAVQVVFGSADRANVKGMGDLIRWMVNDVVKEETDALVANNLEPKDVNSSIANKTRQMFFNMSLEEAA